MSEKQRFWVLLILLLCSIALAVLINSSVSQTLSNQFTG